MILPTVTSIALLAAVTIVTGVVCYLALAALNRLEAAAVPVRSRRGSPEEPDPRRPAPARACGYRPL